MRNDGSKDGSTRRRPVVLRRLPALVLPLGLMIFTQGCAAMFTGTSDEVHFTGIPPGGTVEIRDTVHPLPATIKVSKKVDEVTFRHPDFPERVVELEKSFQAGFLLMDILFTPGFGLSGILIDGATGAWNKHEPQVHCDFTVPAEKAQGEEGSAEQVTAALSAS